jgi:4-hydroxythreonine-4-phosphate dehydrogenase
MAARRLPLALTQGDPAGIGPELALLAWRRRDAATPAFFILADPDHLTRLAAVLGLGVPVKACAPDEAATLFAEALPVVPLSRAVEALPGRPDPASAAMTLESIDRAVDLVHRGQAGAVVTNPIAKDILYAAGFSHPGHTEYLGDLAQQLWGAKVRPVMLLWCPELAVVPVSVHIALEAVPAALTKPLIIETATIVARDMQRRFGLRHPRLAVTGLNPHAGENGAMGRQEIEIIGPAIAELQASGIAATGPFPADTLFHAAARRRYDVALAMYHDQALLPVKTLAFDTAVNVTLGLPFVRTSPDHGTAFDIAGKGIANPASLLAALALAHRLAGT